jgi:uncharacterized protein
MKRLDHSNHVSSLFFCVTLLLCLMFAASACAVNEKEKKETISKGVAAVARGDYEAAYNLVLPLADRGDADAQAQVALFIANGYGSKEARLADEEGRELLAWPWVKKSALGGNRQSIDWIAETFEFGRLGVTRDDVSSKCWRDVSKGLTQPTKCPMPIPRRTKSKR